MLNQMANEQESLEAIGRNTAEYEQKIAWLRTKWDGKKDDQPTRIIGKLVNHAAPLFKSVIADNLSYFETHVKLEQINPNQTIALACLSGSEKVANFIMAKIGVNYLTPEYNYMLSYVCASKNIEWAKTIATTISEAGKPMPKGVSSLSDDSTVSIIREIFNQKNSTNIAKY